MKKLFILAVTVCSILSSCSSPEEVPEPTPQPTPEAEATMPINLSIDNAVRANDETFEANDEVGVYVVNYTDGTASTLALSGNQADNMRFTYIDNAWTPDEAIYWKDDSTPADIIVYYPYAETVSSVTAHPFSVQTDQSTASNFWASDFLWGEATNISPTVSAVPVTTNHSLSRIILNLQSGEGYTAEDWAAAEKSVSITNVKTSATIDLSTGIATATGEVTNVTPLKVSESDNTICYHAMMIPQEITGDATLIKVTINGKEYTITQSITLKPRTQHGFNLKTDRVTGELKLSIGEWETEYAELSNEITYTTTDGKALEFSNWNFDADDVDIFGASITSNTYSNGKGVITFDGGISKIGENAFEECSNLSSIIIPEGVTQIGDDAFNICSNLSSIDLPAGLTQIGDYAFGSCSNLSSIIIPDGVTQIGDGAFYVCYNLSSIIIPDGVTQIGVYAFGRCYSLSSIIIPASIERINHGAFFSCSQLETVDCKAVEPPFLEVDVFQSCEDLVTINVPAASVDAYKAADGWKDYADIIVGYDFTE